MLVDAMGFFSLVLETAGVAAILVGFAYGVFRSVRLLFTGARPEAYATARRVFGKSILLGLEVLVAADLIRTIAVDPTLENLYVLGVLIVIRTFLSWSLDVELEGVWPWNRRRAESQRFAGDTADDGRP